MYSLFFMKNGKTKIITKTFEFFFIVSISWLHSKSLKKCHGFIRQRKKNHRKSIISRKICINMCVGAVSKPPIGCIETDQNRSNETYAWVLLWLLLLLFAYIHFIHMYGTLTELIILSIDCLNRFPYIWNKRTTFPLLFDVHKHLLNVKETPCTRIIGFLLFYLYISPALSLRMDQ